MDLQRPAPDAAPRQPWRQHLWRVILQSDTPAGRLFDQVVLVVFLVSVAVVLADRPTSGASSRR